MRIGIDCDGVLRDFIPALIDSIKETHPEHTDKIKPVHAWEWESWLPFWTEDETEKYVFEDNYLDFFGVEASPIMSFYLALCFICWIGDILENKKWRFWK